MADKFQELWKVLGTLGESSQFVATGSLPPLLPGLDVKKVGPIGIPVSQADAKRLIQAASQAPYGRGEETIVDTKVRRVWQIEPKQISLQNSAWNGFLEQMIASVKSEFGIEQAVEHSLYKLLIYEPGSFFAPHRDSEKVTGMFATLVVCLPSRHAGGTLVVTHDGQTKAVDFGGKNAEFQIQYAAFYADCQHEITPVTAGFRVCLVYNLSLAKAKRQPTAPQNSQAVQQGAEFLSRLFQDKPDLDKVAIPLEHQYTEAGFNPRQLKGADRIRADVLSRAAQQLGLQCYFALLTHYQMGDVDYSTWDPGSSWGRRRYRHDDEEEYEEEEEEADNSAAEMGEVYEEELSLEHWFDPRGRKPPLGKIHLEQNEILSKEEAKDRKYTQEIHEATGNEGVTVERWYRRAAVVIWPRDRYCRIVAGEGPAVAIPALQELVKDAAKPPADPECLALAEQTIAHWKKTGSRRIMPIIPGAPSNAAAMLKLLGKIGSSELVSRFLQEVLPENYDGSEGKILTQVIEKLGWKPFGGALKAFFAKQRPDLQSAKLAPLTAIFEALCCAPPAMEGSRREVCTAVAQQVETIITQWDACRGAYAWHRNHESRTGIPESVIHAYCALGDSARVERFIEHVLAHKPRYPLHDVLIPAVKAIHGWAARNVAGETAFSRLANHCIVELRSLTAEPVLPPTDWSREANLKCTCPDCRLLATFLRDPVERVHRFSIRQDRRQHLHQQINSRKCDLTHVTDRRGSPQTLVCTKTQASYERRLKQYHVDQQLLADLEQLSFGSGSSPSIPAPHKPARKKKAAKK